MNRMLMGLSVAGACVALAAANRPSKPPPQARRRRRSASSPRNEGRETVVRLHRPGQGGRYRAVEGARRGVSGEDPFQGRTVRQSRATCSIRSRRRNTRPRSSRRRPTSPPPRRRSSTRNSNSIARRSWSRPVRHAGDGRHDARRARQRQGERPAKQGGPHHRPGEPELYRYHVADRRPDRPHRIYARAIWSIPPAACLATIVSDDPIYAEFPVSVRQIADLAAAHKGDIAGPTDIKVFVTLANGEPYDQPGDWNYVGNQVDQQTDTLLVRARPSQPASAAGRWRLYHRQSRGGRTAAEAGHSEIGPAVRSDRRLCPWSSTAMGRSGQARHDRRGGRTPRSRSLPGCKPAIASSSTASRRCVPARRSRRPMSRPTTERPSDLQHLHRSAAARVRRLDRHHAGRRSSRSRRFRSPSFPTSCRRRSR